MKIKKRTVMCTYSLMLDDQLVAEAESTLKGVSMQVWLQQQVEALLREQACRLPRRAHARHRRSHALSDSQLAELLKDNAPLNAESFPDLSAADYAHEFQSRSGKLPKGLEKWL